MYHAAVFEIPASADIDNDGDLDLLLVGLDGAETVGFLYRNRGHGTFDFVRAFTDIGGYMGGFADLNNDGDVNLVFAGDDIVYRNNGIGAFSVGPTIPVGGIDDPRAIAFADIDVDGDLDFAIGANAVRTGSYAMTRTPVTGSRSGFGQPKHRPARSVRRCECSTAGTRYSDREKAAATMGISVRTTPSFTWGSAQRHRSRSW